MDFGDGFLPDGRIYVSYEGVEFVRWKEWPAAGSEAAKLLAISPYRYDLSEDEDESWESDEEDIPGALAATTAAAAEEVPQRVIAILSEVAEDKMMLDSELVDGIDSLGATLVLNNLQMQLGVNISVTDWMEMERVSDVVDRVLKELPAPAPVVPKRKIRRKRMEVDMEEEEVQTVQTGPTASPADISEKVLAILNEVAEEDEKLSLDTALTDGIDSLGSTLVINNIQAAFGVTLSITSWMEMETAGDLTKFVTGLVEEQAPISTPVAPKKKSKPKRASQARRSKQGVETKPLQSSASVSGVRVHRQGIGPRVFLVDAHPPEAEELADLEKVQERRAELAAALAPCTVCSLIFDEEACKCANLAELVRLYTRRVNAHRMIYPDAVEGEPLALAAWSFSRVIASALASSLEKSGVQDVRLILFKDGLLLPEPSEEEGDEWWGGATEAVLFTASACSAAKWAKEERRRLRKKGALRQLREDEDEVEDMQMRLFWEEGAKPGHLQQLGPKRFAELANTTGRKVEILRSLTKGAKGVLDFQGRAAVVGVESSRPKAARHVRLLNSSPGNVPEDVLF